MGLKEIIEKKGYMPEEIRRVSFSGMNYQEIRDWMENVGLDPHTAIELQSVEIAIKSDNGVILQVRADDNEQLGLWGGVVRDNETYIQAAVREFEEETGIKLSAQEFEFVELDNHEHTYANGDKAIFKSARYVVELENPEIQLNAEAVGCLYLPEGTGKESLEQVLSHQRTFVKNLL